MEKTLNKWKINKSLLASKMGMTNTTFNKKISGDNSNNFSEAEIIKMKMVLKEMRDDLTDIIEIDFNDALKLMVTK